jgi:molybdopterin converting factor subunit 1
MKVPVKLFAMVREVAGYDEITLTLPDAIPTVGELRAAMLQQYVGLAALLPFCQVAVNQEIAGDEQVLQAQDEVAILPPFSGG